MFKILIADIKLYQCFVSQMIDKSIPNMYIELIVIETTCFDIRVVFKRSRVRSSGPAPSFLEDLS